MRDSAETGYNVFGQVSSLCQCQVSPLCQYTHNAPDLCVPRLKILNPARVCFYSISFQRDYPPFKGLDNAQVNIQPPI